MSILPDNDVYKHQPARIEGELPHLGGEAHVRHPVPAREQSTLESLSSAFRGLGSMTRASTQPSRTTTYAPFSPTSPTFSNNLMLSDDDGGPDEAFYTNRLSLDMSGNEHIIWSGWDRVWWNDQNTPSRLLLLGYRGGIQVWDCTHEQVREVLNLLSPTIGGAVIGAAIIPTPVSSQDDIYSEERPLLGILTSRPDELLIYSLRNHTVLKRHQFTSPQAIQTSDQFIVISTVAPPALHILNSVTLDHLSTISAPHVALPVFALSRRVLAYASGPPPPSTSPTPTPSSTSPSKVQADISMAIEGARKVGVGMWSGVKSLLGENIPRSPSAHPTTLHSPTPMSPPLTGSPRMYSRSAPSESSYSTGSLPRVTISGSGDSRPPVSQGHVTVVDLEPLLSGSQSPRRIVQHHATPGQGVSILSFSSAGNLLAVTGADGIFVRIFEVRPKGRYSKGGPRLTKRDELNELEERDTGSLWHWYDLQRGLTRRRVTNVVWSADSKWITVATVRGTLHIFAINPYGGAPSGASHLLGSGRIANMTQLPKAPISLSPILRIHMPSGVTTSDTQPQAKGVPVTVTFGRPSKPDDDSAVQDIFILNRATGELMLKQCIVRMQSASAIERSMQASISLPNALSNSVAGTGVSALSSMMRGGVGAVLGERGADDLVLGGVEGPAKTWGIVKREREWGEIRKALEPTKVDGITGKKAKSSGSEWLAQAELSTCTRSSKLLSGPIYLSHQFAFYGLIVDWQALLQQHHFNIPSTKINVRREVSVRPIAESGSEGAFLGSGTDDIFGTSSSLDAPLASALKGSLSPTSASQAPIPSFPNAYSGGKSTTWNDPVRRLSRLSDGLGQGLGSLKREIGKVRPSSGSGERRQRLPKSPASPEDSTPGTKLEFDDDALFEADEDLPPGNIEEPTDGANLRPSREDDASRSAESGSGSVPSTVPDMTMLASPDVTGDWPGDGDSFRGEEEDYIQAREEDNRFDDLVVGLMDEEQEERRMIMESATSKKKKQRKKHTIMQTIPVSCQFAPSASRLTAHHRRHWGHGPCLGLLGFSDRALSINRRVHQLVQLSQIKMVHGLTEELDQERRHDDTKRGSYDHYPDVLLVDPLKLVSLQSSLQSKVAQCIGRETGVDVAAMHHKLATHRVKTWAGCSN
ncbi:acetyltransferase activator, partial [Rhizoctonia solani]